jgi:hypothetical protein
MSTGEPLLPPGWRRRRHRDGALVATAPAAGAGGVPPRLAWRTGPPPAYDGLDVEDEDGFDLDGHEVGYRRFGHRVGGVEVVSEEWTWLVDGVPHVLTGTVRREDYLVVCDLFEEVAASVDPRTL